MGGRTGEGIWVEDPSLNSDEADMSESVADDP